MYLDAAGQPTACPDPNAGLHIKDRAGAAAALRGQGRGRGRMRVGPQCKPLVCARWAPAPPPGCPRPPAGSVVRVSIPEGDIGFQVGEALQVHSGGLLRGTPHCVVAPRRALCAGVSRETFACFMQPRWDAPLDAPAGADPQQVGIGAWRPGQTFGEFSERTFDAYYAPGGGGGGAGQQS